MPFAIYESPIGPLTLAAGGDGSLTGLRFPRSGPAKARAELDSAALAGPLAQLAEYFDGTRREFALELDLHGSTFQRWVWDELRRIPYGQTTTYGALARKLALEHERPSINARAVGSAVGSTPVPIIVPCHRVIGADGSLTGYGGGLQRKRALLEFEAADGDRGALDAAWHQRQLTLA